MFLVVLFRKGGEGRGGEMRRPVEGEAESGIHVPKRVFVQLNS